MHTQTLASADRRIMPWHALPVAPHNAPAAHPAQALSRADLRRLVATMID